MLNNNEGNIFPGTSGSAGAASNLKTPSYAERNHVTSEAALQHFLGTELRVEIHRAVHDIFGPFESGSVGQTSSGQAVQG